ncbi:MAG: TetR/AcrR family transcriptional regulator [Bacillota bacterium]
MPNRQEQRSEETKRAILEAARELFAARGFDAVTMREIAKAAGCSHTTIYIYFKDKEALLHQLAMGPLQALREAMEQALSDPRQAPRERLKLLSQVFLDFCLSNRSVYTTLFITGATRVDEPEPELEVNRLRNHLFGLLQRAVGEALPPGLPAERVLAYARACFFTLHGIIATYAASAEPFDQLMERLASTFDLALEVMLTGSIQIAEREVR